MPTINPRVNVTLSPSLFLLVDQLSRLQRASKSQVLRELLEAAEPALQRAVALMNAAEQAKGAVRTGFADSMMRAQDKIEVQLAELLQRADAVTGDLVDQAQAVKGKRRPAAVAPSAPYSGLDPTGKRVVLGAGEYFDKAGILRRKPARTGAARPSGRPSQEPSTPVPVTRGSGTGKTRRQG